MCIRDRSTGALATAMAHLALLILTSALPTMAARSCTFSVVPWGADSFRVRCSFDGVAYSGPGALAGTSPPNPPEVDVPASTPDSWTNGAPHPASDPNSWTNGNLGLSLDGGTMTLSRGGDSTLASFAVEFEDVSGAGDTVNVSTLSIVNAGANWGYYGFGEHENGSVDQLGKVYDMESCIEYSKSRGGEVCLPWIMIASDLGGGKQIQYGLLWNVPAYGGVDFGNSSGESNTWRGYNIDQVDLFVTTFGAGKQGFEAHEDVMRHYVDAVGHAPPLPDWAAGYWHSKNRYSSQQEVLETIAVFRNNFSDIKVAVFVIDYFNWAIMGDLTFDPTKWPDPKAMVDTLKAGGTRVMVSTWPFSQGASKTYPVLHQNRFAVYNASSPADSVDWPDGVCGHPCYLYDASNPAARRFWWGEIKTGYYDYGIEIFWLDAAEPEQMGGSPNGSTWGAGSFQRTGMMFPYYHTQTYYDGMSQLGNKDFVMLSRSAWAGMSKHRAALWNGDTQSDFSFLASAIQAAQSIQLSGIAWWTTDIGGYSGGDPSNPSFNELIVRWFQFGFSCPLFRQHGARNTEPWLLSARSFKIVRSVMALRERFKPYIVTELTQTSSSGLPLNRPLWFDAPTDANTWEVDDQYMFGRDYMVAPVYVANSTSRKVYFPAGATWTHFFTNHSYTGGSTAMIDSPLEIFPLFRKEQS
eukprot:TRINITY_DN11875_c0_g17_i1.p1 TRINITY_DN11875_c0_g17~~TRINITY_DN11875_c0_g17_i1.p1  ORF type:complete len:692 (-),score=129.80 TRINITY_DN11875_c0_g17_i1:280-2355(-)